MSPKRKKVLCMQQGLRSPNILHNLTNSIIARYHKSKIVKICYTQIIKTLASICKLAQEFATCLTVQTYLYIYIQNCISLGQNLRFYLGSVAENLILALKH